MSTTFTLFGLLLSHGHPNFARTFSEHEQARASPHSLLLPRMDLLLLLPLSLPFQLDNLLRW